ncbi:MAG: Hsp20/alpha crystallin family protein [Desulfobacterales bacterium]|nr:Hsp20/alpha crystallin family protein [Desulfobacterales bacterium]
MELVRFSPWNDVWNMTNRFNRIFGSTFTPARTRDESCDCTWRPVVDIYEEENGVALKAELPGIDKSDIAIDVKDRVLTLSGERTVENETEDKTYYRRERTYGKFQRVFTLPEGISADDVTADFKDGVLKVHIPKATVEEPKKITIH